MMKPKLPKYRLVRALEIERVKLHPKQSSCEFVKGMAHGLTLAIAVVEDLWKQVRCEKA